MLFFSFPAYDQTRVKLNVLNGDPNSDYINANFVMGYKERKRFVCAQGPMEGTVYDFWRMAWEQRVEIIVMLTNLEEYNKTKCFQYWPDPDQLRDTPTPEPLYVDPVSEVQSNGTANHSPTNGSNGSNGSNGTNGTNGRLDATLPAVPIKSQREKTFGDIRVLHVKEKRYSEYVVRELQVYLHQFTLFVGSIPNIILRSFSFYMIENCLIHRNHFTFILFYKVRERRSS